ncbi:MAG: hypothetical protein J7619_12580 [Dyadobacter sp.]|uniref:DUF6169 family protein n=1 Tax=Dyadobacter sp. TaxID=1914288 RepID=UPI001B2D2BBD|nr:DUF6169 family protein [Dyadobacter sp.]MBO9613530.1 hypothetical protein [Dyadobacter sp.]
MQKESDFLNPYEVVTDDQDCYWFLTESGVCYRAAFIKSYGYFYRYPQFDHQVVTFSFRPYKEDQQPFEGIPKSTSYSSQTRIRDTIIWLLLESFRLHPEKSIVFICESCDKLAACRQRLFDRWFRQAHRLLPAPHCISKYDTDFAGEGYGSIFIYDYNPNHDLIRDAFLDISGSDK